MQTKRILACGATLAVLVVPAAALGAITKTYRGEINGDPETSLNLRIRTEGAIRFFKSFTVKDLELRCEGNPARVRLDSASLSGREPLGERGRFTAKNDDGDATLKVEGRVRKRRASGTLRFSGRAEIEGKTRDCRSGEVDWSAER